MPRFLLPLLLLLAAPAFAQPDIAGDWSGALDVSAVQPSADSLTLIVHVARSGDGYTATLDSPDQGAYGVPFDSVAYDGATFEATLASANVTYTGAVSAGGDRIEGTFVQGGRAMPLVLTPYEAPAAGDAAEAGEAGGKAAPKPGDFSGTWLGAMPIPNGGEVRITFYLTRLEDGTYEAALTPPGQTQRMELGSITVEGREVTIPIMGQASFTGTVAADERTMEGTFAQGDAKTPMTLTRQ